MSFLGKLKSVPRYLPHGTSHGGLKGVAVDKGERYGAAFGFGYAKAYYGEKFLYKGHGLDLWSGVALSLGSAAASAFGYHKIAPHLERVGDAGIMSALGSLGASMGLQHAGRSVAVLNPGKNAGKLAGAKSSVVGAIPAARGGHFLSAEEIAAYAQRR